MINGAGDPSPAFKHHYCYISERWERRRRLKDVHADEEEERGGGRESPKGRGSDPGAYVSERVKWKRWRSPLKVRKEWAGKLRVLIWQ